MITRILVFFFCLCLFMTIQFYGFSAQNQNEQTESLSRNSNVDSKYEHHADDDCESCHKMSSDYPSYSELNSKNCDECHKDSFTRSSVTEWTHPLQDAALVGTGCSDCHSINTDGQMPRIKHIDSLCIACHSDIRDDFRLLSHHPLSEGLLDCSDCHTVHNKRSTPLMVQDLEYLGVLAYEWHDPLKQNESCLRCHSWFSLTSLTGSEFIIANVDNLHKVHCEEGFSACIECHIPHGSYAPKLIRERLLDGKTLLYNRGEGWGTCSTTCHSQSHIQASYGSDPRMLVLQ
jgi:hypothetical protein